MSIPLPGSRRRAPLGAREAGVTVTWMVRELRGAAALLRRVARHVARAEGFRSGELSLAVVGARRMARLHQQFMNIAGPTDVLTFDHGTDRVTGRVDGEIVVCADVARAVAARKPAARSGAARTPPIVAELALYVVHGVLHLAGYDDHSAAGFRRMHAREDALLKELGLGAVFAD